MQYVDRTVLLSRQLGIFGLLPKSGSRAMRVLFVIALAMATTAGGYAAIQSYRSKRPTPAAARAAGDHAATQRHEAHAGLPNDSAELAALRRQVASLGAQVEDLRAQASRTTVESGEPPDPADPERETMLREERRAHIADLEAQFVDEPRDAGWSSATFHAITEALNANELRNSATSIECHSQTCRVEIADNGPNTNRLLMRAVRQLGSSLPTVEWDHIDDGNGRRSKVLYLSKRIVDGRH